MKKKFIILLACFLVVLLAGCGKKENTTQVDIEVVKPTEPVKKLKIIDTSSKTRPYAVMINNLAEARTSRSGLNDASIVYEIIVEGGITRMLALFKDENVDRLGSGRSSRHYY